jgi:AraC-like DNA-binding protein
MSAAMSGKWARSSALLAVDQLIADLGGNVEAAFAHAGISVAALQQPELPLPAQAVVELFESAAEHCRCDSFGLQLACRQTLAVIGPLWQLAQTAPDIRTLLQQLEQFFQHVTSGAQISLEQRSEGVALCYSLASGVSPRDRHTIELGLGLLCREIRRHCGPRWQPKSVQLRHSPPREQDWHRQIFGSKLFFNQERNAVHFDQATLQQPLIDGRQPNQQLLRQLQQHAQPGIALQTEKLLRDMLPFFRCSLPMLAQALGCSTRTLQRNLAAAGTSVQDLRDQVRADLALKYLQQSSLPVIDIAEILGYTSQSAFTRSFRRWYGVNPLSARKHAAIWGRNPPAGPITPTFNLKLKQATVSL